MNIYWDITYHLLQLKIIFWILQLAVGINKACIWYNPVSIFSALSLFELEVLTTSHQLLVQMLQLCVLLQTHQKVYLKW